MAEQQIRSILSENLRKYRNRRNWSQMELSEKVNISMNYLSEIERGLKWPHPDILQNLASALDIEVFELFKSENNLKNGDSKYMKRFSNDIALAVEQAVKKAVSSVQKQYK